MHRTCPFFQKNRRPLTYVYRKRIGTECDPLAQPERSRGAEAPTEIARQLVIRRIHIGPCQLPEQFPAVSALKHTVQNLRIGPQRAGTGIVTGPSIRITILSSYCFPFQRNGMILFNSRRDDLQTSKDQRNHVFEHVRIHDLTNRIPDICNAIDNPTNYGR